MYLKSLQDTTFPLRLGALAYLSNDYFWAHSLPRQRRRY